MGKGRWKGKGGRYTSPLSFIFSSSLYGAYHFASRVLPLLLLAQFPSTCRFRELGGEAAYCRFWIRMKERTILKGGAHALERTGLEMVLFGSCGEVVSLYGGRILGVVVWQARGVAGFREINNWTGC